MSVAVGIDVAEQVHWASVEVAETGKVITGHKVDNTPADIGELIDEISSAANGHGQVTVGVDMLGGIASLLVAMLLAAEITVVHVSGPAVNRARRGTVGGEQRSRRRRRDRRPGADARQPEAGAARPRHRCRSASADGSAS